MMLHNSTKEMEINKLRKTIALLKELIKNGKNLNGLALDMGINGEALKRLLSTPCSYLSGLEKELSSLENQCSTQLVVSNSQSVTQSSQNFFPSEQLFNVSETTNKISQKKINQAFNLVYNGQWQEAYTQLNQLEKMNNKNYSLQFFNQITYCKAIMRILIRKFSHAEEFINQRIRSQKEHKDVVLQVLLIFSLTCQRKIQQAKKEYLLIKDQIKDGSYPGYLAEITNCFLNNEISNENIYDLYDVMEDLNSIKANDHFPDGAFNEMLLLAYVLLVASEKQKIAEELLTKYIRNGRFKSNGEFCKFSDSDVHKHYQYHFQLAYDCFAQNDHDGCNKLMKKGLDDYFYFNGFNAHEFILESLCCMNVGFVLKKYIDNNINNNSNKDDFLSLLSIAKYLPKILGIMQDENHKLLSLDFSWDNAFNLYNEISEFFLQKGYYDKLAEFISPLCKLLKQENKESEKLLALYNFYMGKCNLFIDNIGVAYDHYKKAAKVKEFDNRYFALRQAYIMLKIKPDLDDPKELNENADEYSKEFKKQLDLDNAINTKSKLSEIFDVFMWKNNNKKDGHNQTSIQVYERRLGNELQLAKAIIFLFKKKLDNSYSCLTDLQTIFEYQQLIIDIAKIFIESGDKDRFKKICDELKKDEHLKIIVEFLELKFDGKWHEENLKKLQTVYHKALDFPSKAFSRTIKEIGDDAKGNFLKILAHQIACEITKNRAVTINIKDLEEKLLKWIIKTPDFVNLVLSYSEITKPEFISDIVINFHDKFKNSREHYTVTVNDLVKFIGEFTSEYISASKSDSINKISANINQLNIEKCKQGIFPDYCLQSFFDKVYKYLDKAFMHAFSIHNGDAVQSHAILNAGFDIAESGGMLGGLLPVIGKYSTALAMGVKIFKYVVLYKKDKNDKDVADKISSLAGKRSQDINNTAVELALKVTLMFKNQISQLEKNSQKDFAIYIAARIVYRMSNDSKDEKGYFLKFKELCGFVSNTDDKVAGLNKVDQILFGLAINPKPGTNTEQLLYWDDSKSVTVEDIMYKTGIMVVTDNSEACYKQAEYNRKKDSVEKPEYRYIYNKEIAEALGYTQPMQSNNIQRVLR